MERGGVWMAPQQVQSFGQGSWHHKSSDSNSFAATGTEKAHRAQPADGTMEASKSNQTSNPVFAITIDWSISLRTPTSKCPLYSRGSVEQDKYEAVI